MSQIFKILVINPGSTSTKAAIYENEKEVDARTLSHSAERLARFSSVNDQLDFRRKAVYGYLSDLKFDATELSAVAARGGVIGRLESGAYEVDERLKALSLNSPVPHVSNLAPIIAKDIADEVGVKAYIYDPVCGCGQPDDIFAVSGLPEIPRRFVAHVLNSRAACFERSRLDGTDIGQTCHVVAHLGGGVTVSLIRGGKIVDIVADDEGAMSPERSGWLPARLLVELCYSGRYTEKEMRRKIMGEGGLTAYLGTNDLIEVERRILAGDKKADLLHQAMALQIAKDVASLFPSVDGRVDKIILTGGLAHSRLLTERIEKRVAFLAEVAVMPGSFEVQALALGVLRVLRGQETAYKLPDCPLSEEEELQELSATRFSFAGN
ncbi:MAG: butyrate kinase [Deltaproteobacteria bacterium]|jgi:butyrate kinase|nr:butyrate kinase [Deltaproteobacteria bacterium]